MPKPLRRVITGGATALTVVLVATAGYCWLKVEQLSALNFRSATLSALKVDLMQARHDLATSGLLNASPLLPADPIAEYAGKARLKGVVTELRQRLGRDEHQAPLIERLSAALAQDAPGLGTTSDQLLADMLVEANKDAEETREQSLRVTRQAAAGGIAASALAVAFLLWLSFAYRRRQRQDLSVLLDGLERLRQRDFEYRIPEDDSGFGPLAISFNSTAERLSQTGGGSPMRASTDLADKLLDATSRAILLVKEDGTIAKANAGAEAIFQLSRAEILNFRITELLPEHLLAASKTQITSHTLARRGFQRPFEECAKFTRPDGSELYVDFDIVLLDSGGEVLTYAVITDITTRATQYYELKAAHAQTKAELDRHKVITEAAELGCFLFDLRDHSHHADSRYLAMLGETRATFPPTGDSFFSRVHPEDSNRLRTMTQDQAEGRCGRVDLEFRLRHRDGHWIWVAAVASTIFDEEGRAIGVAGLHRDISAEIATRNELESQRRLLSSLSGNIPGVLHRLVAHADGRRNFRYVGENSEHTLGVPSVQFDLDTLTERMPPESAKEFLDSIEYSIREGFDISREFRVRRGDGEWRWMRMVSRLVASTPGGGGTWDGIFTDVTDEVAQRIALEEARKEADNANRAKSNFLASMSHELRTPLSGMLAVTGLLQETKLAPDQRELLSMQREAGETLMAVLTDVLDLSKIESGKFDLEAEVIDIEKLVRRTMDVVHTQAATKGLALRMSIASDITQYALGDAVRLRQVLLNLLNNAVKFTTAGSIDIHVEEVGGDGEHHQFRFTVADTGVGIDAEAAKDLFEPFRQLGESGLKVGGTGLGLTICRKFVELMNGQIGFDSKPGEGSSFWFVVPLRRVQGVSAPATRWQPPFAANEISAPRPKPLRVLVAEDIKLNQMVTARALERAGHEVKVVSDGEEALNALGCSDFDAIIMDARMPVLDGVETTRRIRSSGGSTARIPIIGVTADVLPARLQECLDAGMNEVMTKPFDRSVLINHLENLTSGRPDSSGAHKLRSQS